MTKEEAIDELSVLYERCTKARQFPNKFYCSLTDGQYIDALDMAFKALKQQPCEDAISRQTAIEAVKQAIYNHDSAIMRLTDLPSVTPSNTQRDNSALERVGDYISRQAVLGIVNGYAERFNGYIDSPNDSEVYAYARGLILSIERNINAVPPVTPQPKIGVWLKNGEFCKCSRCGSNVLFSAVKLYNFCYRCGAKMEVEG